MALLVTLYHELDDRVAYMKGVREALAPGGRVVICDWRPDRDTEKGPSANHRVAEEAVVDDLRQAGFCDIERHALYDAFYVLAARR